MNPLPLPLPPTPKFVWRTGRPRFLCKKHGHIAYSEWATDINGFYLCSCGRWFPWDDPWDEGSTNVVTHPRFSLSADPKPANYTIKPHWFSTYKKALLYRQPSLTFENASRMVMPFVYLRDNPDELAKMNFEDIRRLIIDRLADYEEGMDAA